MKNASNKIDENLNLLKIDKKDRLTILDTIIESLPFCKYHFITTMICIFSMTCEGYLHEHIAFTSNRFMKIYNWTQRDSNILSTAQLIFQCFGAFISTNCRSKNWEITSNGFLALIGLINLIINMIYPDPLIYCATICVFSVFHGFIANICTNFLLELMKRRVRGYLFLVTMSFELIGRAAFGGIVWYFDLFNINDPNTYLLVLAVSQLFLTIFLAVQMDSPRILFYNNDFPYIYNYIKEIDDTALTDEKNKIKIIENLEKVKKEIDDKYEKQEDEGVINGFYLLFNRRSLKNTINAITFIILSLSLVSNIRDNNTLINKFLRNTNFLKTGYDVMLYYITLFIIVNLCNIIFYIFEKIKTIYYHIATISICLLSITCLLISTHSTILIGILEAFGSFYYFLIYLYFCENITTKYRNCISGVLHISTCLAPIFQLYVIGIFNIFSPLTTILANVILGFILIILEISLKDNELRHMNIQEIDLMLLNKMIEN
jgi:hypothetical protein